MLTYEVPTSILSYPLFAREATLDIFVGSSCKEVFGVLTTHREKETLYLSRESLREYSSFFSPG